MQAIDGMCVGLIVTSPSGQIRWANRTATAVLGLDRWGCYQHRFSEVVQDPQVIAFWHDAEQAGDTVMGEISLRFPRNADLKMNATSCVDHSGKLIGRALLFCDVTHERAAQVQLSKSVADAIVNMAGHEKTDNVTIQGLTSQELRVLRHVGEGLSNQAIAEEVGVEVATVRSHLKHIYRKLEIGSRTEAVRFVVENGLL
jgi:DNA-binding CsgD family transcriptional regulator